MDGIFGGVTVPLERDICDLQSNERDLRRFGRHAVVDHFSFDLDRGLILLGPVALKFHGFPADRESIGIRHFVEAYRAEERSGLLCLLERLASEGRPFHYTACLAGTTGRFVHGFIAQAEEADGAAGGWSGIMVLSRSGLEPSARRVNACEA